MRARTPEERLAYFEGFNAAIANAIRYLEAIQPGQSVSEVVKKLEALKQEVH